MSEKIHDFIPEKAVYTIDTYLSNLDVVVKIVPVRMTKHGDYRKLANNKHLITLNSVENPYRFLITLVHELAHFVAFQEFGTRIKPHGKEWKSIFREMMMPLLNEEVFPQNLLSVLKTHFKNPKASSDTDTSLAMALLKYDSFTHKKPILELTEGSFFRINNRKNSVFIKGKRNRKRFLCKEKNTGRLYLFSPHALVELVEN